jgi:hypothetical protein
VRVTVASDRGRRVTELPSRRSAPVRTDPASADDLGVPALMSPPGDPGTADEAAPSWEDVANRYGPTVYTMAYRLTGDRDEARDLAQDVFVRVYRNLDRYRPGTFEGWLYRITKNLFLDRVRRGGRLRLEPLPEEEWRRARNNSSRTACCAATWSVRSSNCRRRSAPPSSCVTSRN